MCNKYKLRALALGGVLVWILSSIWVSQLYIPFTNTDDVSNRGHTQSLPEYIPDVSSVIPNEYDVDNIPSSMHTIPSLFIISAPKSGSSSLIKWLVSTQQIHGDYSLTRRRVENNMLAKYYVDAIITRNDSIGFYISDEQIMKFNDWRYIFSFSEKPPEHKTMFLSLVGDAHGSRRVRNWWKETHTNNSNNTDSGMSSSKELTFQKKTFRTRRGRFPFRSRSKLQTETPSRKLLRSSQHRVNRVPPRGIARKYKRTGRRHRLRGPFGLRKKIHMLYDEARDLNYVDRELYMKQMSSEQTHYTVGKSVFYFHLPYMARIFAIKYPNTKILITIRDPIPRLKSNFLFFIGSEYDELPRQYGNVNVYLEHIMNHKLLIQPLQEINRRLREVNEAQHMNETQWHGIFAIYRVFLVNMVRVCKEEFKQMGYSKGQIMESCKENDLIRSAFGTSCYIVPIMYWNMANLNPKRNLRLLQSESMFARPDEHITRVLCWVYSNANSCNDWNKDTQWKTNKQWRKSETEEAGRDVKIKADLKVKIKKELLQCDVALKRFLKIHPLLQLTPFDFTLWQ
eukprot:348897_1